MYLKCKTTKKGLTQVLNEKNKMKNKSSVQKKKNF